MDHSLHPEPLPPTIDESAVSSLTIWTAALGFFSLLTVGFTAIPAIICGHIALRQIRDHDDGAFERRMARAGLLAGYAGLALAMFSAFTLF